MVIRDDININYTISFLFTVTFLTDVVILTPKSSFEFITLNKTSQNVA